MPSYKVGATHVVRTTGADQLTSGFGQAAVAVGAGYFFRLQLFWWRPFNAKHSGQLFAEFFSARAGFCGSGSVMGSTLVGISEARPHFLLLHFAHRLGTVLDIHWCPQ